MRRLNGPALLCARAPIVLVIGPDLDHLLGHLATPSSEQRPAGKSRRDACGIRWKTLPPNPLSGATAGKTAAQASLARAGQTLTGRASAPASPRSASGAASNLARPSRVGTKRSYQDASFEGYAEAGLTSEDGGFSTGGERRGLMKKARVDS